MEETAASIEGSKSSATSSLWTQDIRKVESRLIVFLPSQPQLSATNSDVIISVEGTAERKVLNFGPFAEQPFGRFVKPFGDVIQHSRSAVLRRTVKPLFQKFSSSAADKNRTREET